MQTRLAYILAQLGKNKRTKTVSMRKIVKLDSFIKLYIAAF